MHAASPTVLTVLLFATAALAQDGQHVVVQRAGSQRRASVPHRTSRAPFALTAGSRVKPPARVSGGTVTFEPGARTAWHTHPLGQTLIVTAGLGLVQHWGGAIQEIRPGDVVWVPPGVKHWHGATATVRHDPYRHLRVHSTGRLSIGWSTSRTSSTRASPSLW